MISCSKNKMMGGKRSNFFYRCKSCNLKIDLHGYKGKAPDCPACKGEMELMDRIQPAIVLNK